MKRSKRKSWQKSSKPPRSVPKGWPSNYIRLLRNLAKTLHSEQNGNLLFLNQLGRLIKKRSPAEINQLLTCRCVRHLYRAAPKCSILEMLQEEVEFYRGSMPRIRKLGETQQLVYAARRVRLERLSVLVKGVMDGEVMIANAIAAETLAQALTRTREQ